MFESSAPPQQRFWEIVTVTMWLAFTETLMKSPIVVFPEHARVALRKKKKRDEESLHWHHSRQRCLSLMRADADGAHWWPLGRRVHSDNTLCMPFKSPSTRANRGCVCETLGGAADSRHPPTSTHSLTSSSNMKMKKNKKHIVHNSDVQHWNKQTGQFSILDTLWVM